MTQVDEQTAAGTGGAGRPGWLLPAVGAGVAVIALVVGLVVLTAGGDGDDGATPTATTAVRTATTAAPTSTAAPATTSSVVAAAVTTAPVPTLPATTAPVATIPGVKPAPLVAPLQEIVLSPGGGADATVATAAVGSLAIYREPLQVPAPAFADWTFEATTQFGTRTAFLVTGVAGDWLRVQLPMKPNGSNGWVHNADVTLSPIGRRIIVDLPNRVVTLFDGDTVLARSASVIGKDDTPTPTGTYYVTDLLKLDDPSGTYGPYVLATSARSDAFDFFNGGEPIVALHGTNEPSLLGSAASNGCVRLPNDVITAMLTMTPVGTPVFIV